MWLSCEFVKHFYQWGVSVASKVIVFANQKGGVGKTTSCVNMAASLVAAKKKCLLVDLDPQGNATMGSGVNKATLNCSINEVLLEQAAIDEAIISKTPGGFALLPANGDLTTSEISLLKKRQREQKLRNALADVRNRYDFILIDCPPSLNMLTLNALVAADSVIIPMQCEYYALEGLSALLGTISQIQEGLNPTLKIEGIIRTMYDPRNRLSLDVSAQLIEHFGDRVYKTPIPRNVRLAEAPSHGVPILLYDKASRGAAAYLALAGELIKKNKSMAKQASSKKVLETA